MRDFLEFYWLKEELQRFCREQGLAPSGSKRVLEERIEHFLRTGRPMDPRPSSDRPSAEARRLRSTPASGLSMDTRAPRGFRCTQQVRAFFLEHLGPGFRFTVPLQRFIREHHGVTFEKIAEEWRRQEAHTQAGETPSEIAPQFEYNRFTRDYFADPKNRRKTRHDCVEAWKRARARRGDRRYRPGDGER